MSNYFDVGGFDIDPSLAMDQYGYYDDPSAMMYDPMMSGMDAYSGAGFDDPWGMQYDPMLTGQDAYSNGFNWGQYMPSGSTAGLLGLGGLNLLGQYYGANQQQQGADNSFDKMLAAQQSYQDTQRTDIANAQNTALANWQKYAFPSQDAVQAGINMGKGAISQATNKSGQALDEKLASRGFGAGSGEIARGWTDLYKGQNQNLAQLTNQMTQFANTPYSAPPITSAYPGMPSVPNYAQPTSFGERAANMLSGVTGTMGGIYAYDWLKNMK